MCQNHTPLLEQHVSKLVSGHKSAGGVPGCSCHISALECNQQLLGRCHPSIMPWIMFKGRRLCRTGPESCICSELRAMQCSAPPSRLYFQLQTCVTRGQGCCTPQPSGRHACESSCPNSGCQHLQDCLLQFALDKLPRSLGAEQGADSERSGRHLICCSAGAGMEQAGTECFPASRTAGLENRWGREADSGAVRFAAWLAGIPGGWSLSIRKRLACRGHHAVLTPGAPSRGRRGEGGCCSERTFLVWQWNMAEGGDIAPPAGRC